MHSEHQTRWRCMTDLIDMIMIYVSYCSMVVGDKWECQCYLQYESLLHFVCLLLCTPSNKVYFLTPTSLSMYQIMLFWWTIVLLTFLKKTETSTMLRWIVTRSIINQLDISLHRATLTAKLATRPRWQNFIGLYQARGKIWALWLVRSAWQWSLSGGGEISCR